MLEIEKQKIIDTIQRADKEKFDEDVIMLFKIGNKEELGYPKISMDIDDDKIHWNNVVVKLQSAIFNNIKAEIPNGWEFGIISQHFDSCLYAILLLRKKSLQKTTISSLKYKVYVSKKLNELPKEIEISDEFALPLYNSKEQKWIEIFVRDIDYIFKHEKQIGDAIIHIANNLR